jgi:hypothetical protein
MENTNGLGTPYVRKLLNEQHTHVVA